MFRACHAHHQEKQIVSIQLLINVTPCWWQCRVLVGCKLVGQLPRIIRKAGFRVKPGKVVFATTFIYYWNYILCELYALFLDWYAHVLYNLYYVYPYFLC